MKTNMFLLTSLLCASVGWKTAGALIGIDCYECKAGLSADECENTANSTRCPDDHTNCFTLTANIVNGSTTTRIAMKGCRNLLEDPACNDTCATVNATLGDAYFSSCIIECCFGPNCNNGSYPFPTTATPTTVTPTATIAAPTTGPTGNVHTTSKGPYTSGSFLIFIAALSVLVGLAAQN